ncbi:DUF4845 domain-containing protein [Chitinilyticum piscinae]|uniref:DUF4845 domain-containing protein n=1 Tax=Chitinilyticum piscinae TaxID=2866724 RepID=A0A8J7FKQ3_9NEIS|nr:DUF4845 domain-containing protein [Chitinilyticum piscinae]MBE9609812.1 DUF4845 domain-containing protein [Chitinilyticum piscinae]
MLKKQSGISFVGFIIIAIFVALAAVLAFKVVPAYLEFFTIKKAINSVARDGVGKAPDEIRGSFARHAEIEYIKAVNPQDLVINNSGGALVVSVSYEQVVPVVANVSLLFSFEASSKAKGE